MWPSQVPYFDVRSALSIALCSIAWSASSEKSSTRSACRIFGSAGAVEKYLNASSGTRRCPVRDCNGSRSAWRIGDERPCSSRQARVRSREA